MIYNLKNVSDIKRFNKRTAFLEANERLVELTDVSKRTLNQNSYLHVLIRIVALELGVTEDECKQAFFKRMANKDIFVKTIADPMTGETEEVLKKSSALTIPEMSKAIDNFRRWSEEHGIYLPEADVDEENELIFASEEDMEAYFQALVETSKYDNYL